MFNLKPSSYLIAIASLLLLSGCATSPGAVSSRPQFNIPGIYHTVEKGQTLWRISKTYNVDLDEVVRINRIPDAANIEQGQLIFIPYAKKKTETFKYSAGEEFEWPLRGRVIAGFGQTHDDMINKGINIERTRSEDVLASRGGKVVFYDPAFERFGKTLIIDHGDGFSTVYAGVFDLFVKTGDYVKKGALIAKLGPSHRKEPYLHFEVRKSHIPQNPNFYLP
ncbi:MAG: LysM peptidoglycan-binding domain-containing M23 family metallopeptidase [Candidatus Omnitrophota bacterium]|jgi:murein DD-endopeptidase MepM/ murein hydrolase activator NlpD